MPKYNFNIQPEEEKMMNEKNSTKSQLCAPQAGQNDTLTVFLT